MLSIEVKFYAIIVKKYVTCYKNQTVCCIKEFQNCYAKNIIAIVMFE